MRMSILMKLLVGFAAVILIMGIGGSFVMLRLSSVDAAYGHVITHTQTASALAAKVQAGVSQQISSLRGYLVEGSASMQVEYGNVRYTLETDLGQLTNYVEDDEELKAKIEKLRELSQNFTWPADQIFTLVKEGKAEEARGVASREAAPIATDMSALADQILREFSEQALADVAETRAYAATTRLIGYAAFTAAAVFALLMGFIMARVMAQNVRKIAALAGQVSDGNLAADPVRVSGRDELADLAKSINQMVASLRGLVHSVTASTNQVAGAADTLSEISGQASDASSQAANAVTKVAAGASRQAEATTEVSRTVEQLKRAIEQVAAGAGQSSRDVQQAAETLTTMVADIDATTQSSSENAEAAAEASSTAARGARSVEETIAGMDRIRTSVEASADRIRHLADVSRQIGAITEAISGIAGQTNLLALNAAIEAARAGEHGRGFAVVAEEVRKLAESAAGSAREIAGLIQTIQNETQEAVKAMEAGRAEVEAGAKLAAGAGETLRQMQAAAAQTALAVKAIAERVQASFSRIQDVTHAFEAISAVTEQNTASTEEMAASAQLVTDAIYGINGVAQENAAIAEEVSASTEEVTASAQAVSASAQELQQIARRLREQVEQFRV
ncbi:MAG TPA: methyl-accepting chemotaxis protein [Symbiobacteriaceae bacterium]|nr:methyl-accepting chemotaxis protein [Symbiobacteriaceae bacterium]